MPRSLSFDLVVSTLGRVSQLSSLLESVTAQSHRRFRVVVVDQNDDGLLDDLVSRDWDFPVLPLTSEVGISRGRNRGLARVTADVVAFPDDDCRYPPTLLEHVAARFAAEPELDGLTGRLVGFDGVPEPGSWREEAGLVDLDNVWSSGVSATMFLRSELVRRIGPFDTRLGLGSDAGARSGEEIDLLVRALMSGARIRHEPSLLVEHRTAPAAVRFSAERGLRDGLSVGYILRKNRLPPRVVARMLVRPFLGALVRLVQLDGRGARFQAATLAGRARGLVARSANGRRRG